MLHGVEPFSVVIIFISFSSSTLFPSSHGAALHYYTTLPPLPSSGSENEDNNVVDFPWGISRFDVQGPIGEPVEGSTLILAPKRTCRKDPLDGFKIYTGGWNISDRHYWASVGFTAAPLFLVSAFWFLGFGLCLLLTLLCHICRGIEPRGYSKTAYTISLILLVTFSLAAILGCAILYAGQGKFHTSTRKALEYVVNQLDTTVKKLKNISDQLASTEQIGVDKVFLPSNVQTDINRIESRLDSSMSTLAGRTKENSNRIKNLLNSMRLALITIAAVMLVLTSLGFLSSVFGMQLLVYILVIIGWLLVAGTFILSGIFLLLHTASEDTCVALDHWIHNPTAHTALDDILPCADTATARESLTESKEVSSQLVEVINQVITNVSNINFSPNFVSMYFNQSGRLVPTLCNPFYSDLTDRPCSPGEVDYNNATQVWGDYVCEVSASGICVTTGRLTPDFFNQMTSVIDVIAGLHNYAPFLAELQDCTFVRRTFTDIYKDHCPGLRQYSRWIYIGLVIVSAAVMLSTMFWVIYCRERRRLMYKDDDELVAKHHESH